MQTMKYCYLILLTIFLLSTSGCVSAQPSKPIIGSVQITTVGPRALRDALRILEAQLDCVITYEDPKYKGPGMVQALFPGGFKIPRDRTVLFTYQTTANENPFTIVQTLLNDFNNKNTDVKFDVIQSKLDMRMLNVRPVSEQNVGGRMEISDPMLNRKLSLNTTNTYANIIKSICSQISSQSSGINVYIMPRTFNNTQITLHSHIATALVFLNNLLSHYNSKVKDKFSWNLNIDPEFTPAVVSFHQVVAKKADEPGSMCLNIESTRPAADASVIIGDQIHRTIIYEDIPYLCPCQLIKNQSGEPQVPSGGIFSFSYSSHSEPLKILTDGLLAFNKHSIGKFVVKPVDKNFYIYPTEQMNANEKRLPHKPLLETSIFFTPKGKPVKENLKDLCAVLTMQSPYKVSLGELPSLPLFKQIATEDVTKQPAVE